MRRIYKYPIMSDFVKIKIPVLVENGVEVDFKSQVLHLDYQNKIPCLWILVDTGARIATRCIETFGTGFEIPENILLRDFLGTLQNPPYVWHFFYNAKESYDVTNC